MIAPRQSPAASACVRRSAAALLVATLLTACTTKPPDPCLQAVTRTDMVGSWTGWVGEDRLLMVLRPHAEHAIGLQGQVEWQAGTLPRIARLAGDVDHRQLILEESQDGYEISGEWEGEITPQRDRVGCLLVVRGQWRALPGESTQPFTLQRPRP